MKAFYACAVLLALVNLGVQALEVELCFRELESKLASMEVPSNIAALTKVVPMDQFADRVAYMDALKRASKEPELRDVSETIDRTCNLHFGAAFEKVKYSTSCGNDIDNYMALYSENAVERAQFLPKFPHVAQLNEAFEVCASIISVHKYLRFEPDVDIRRVIPLYKQNEPDYLV